jgi:UrcA family protein
MLKNTLPKNALIAASLASFALAAQPALASAAAPAQADREVQHRMVSYADLDLSTAGGQAKFDARLRRAAATVCEANYGPHPLTEAMEARRCYRDALQSAQRTMANRGADLSAVRVAAR